jgi:hypothetical protein
MKTTRIGLILLLLLGTAAGAGYASVGTAVGVSIHTSNVDLGFFYDDLAPYGTWVQTPGYGWAWAPSGVSVSWRPYENGHWIWTDLGWTWVSDEPFGWATYHYGNWAFDPEFGWMWIPGHEWAPAWVSWQVGPDYIGWGPVPPSYRFGGRVALAPEDCVFVPSRDFLAPSVARFAVAPSRVRPIFRDTRNYTSFRRVGGSVFVGGLSVDRVQRYTGRRVPRYQVTNLGAGFRHRGALVRGDRVEVFRPRVSKTRVDPPSARRAAKRSVMTVSQFRAAHGRHVNRAAVPTRSTRGREEVRKQAVRPPRKAVPQRGRSTRTSQSKAVPRKDAKPAKPKQHVRPPARKQDGNKARTQRVQPPKRTQHGTKARTQHVRPPVRTQHARQSVRTQQARRPAPKVHTRRAPARQHASQRQARPAPRHARQAHQPAKQQQKKAQPRRHRPPQ